MKTMLALAALAGALCVAPAAAQSPSHRSQVVSVDGLDLGTERGRAALDRRIRTAVQTACGTASSADLEGRNDVRRCREEALASVGAQRDRSIATALRPSPAALASQR